MKAAGFGGVFCNTRDFPPGEWEQIIVPRAKSLGMFCGPWGRTTEPSGAFSYTVLSDLVATARAWGSPLVVNSENELTGSGATYTIHIANAIKGLDAAVIMEPWLFNPPSVDWTPLADVPMLLEIFPADSPVATHPEACFGHAHDCGIKCVYFCFGTYGSQTPSLYDLKAPYSLFDADACGANYERWKPTSVGFQACVQPPVNGGNVLTPNQKKAFREQLARYLFVAEKYNYRWHYTQNRPVTGYHLAPSATHYADCSSFESLAFYAAGVWSASPINDPLNMHYSGYGNTESEHLYLKAHHAPLDKYRIGDIALYLQDASWHHHTTVCCIAGTGQSAWFMSNGQEADPRKTKLHYRNDLTGVYRHPALL